MAAPSQSRVLAVKIKGTQISEGFPFDKVYLARQDSLPALLDSFPYCLSFKLESGHAGALKHLDVHYTATQGVGRSAAPSWVGGPRFRGEGQGSPLWSLTIGGVTVDLSRSLADFSSDTEGWNVVVPILTQYSRKIGSAAPSYMVSPHRSNASGPYVGLLDEGVSLNKRGSPPLCPPCLACARLLHHLQGDCSLGTAVCYENLSFDGDSYFQRGLALQKLLPHMTLLEAVKLRAGATP